MEQKKIDRISELTRISRERELTKEETEERAQLRAEYIQAFKSNLVASLENMSIVDEKGKKTPVRKKNERKFN